MGMAVWRLSYMLQNEDGPGGILEKFRGLLFDGADVEGRQKIGFLSPMVGCLYCLSIWVSVPFAVYLSMDDLILLPVHILALSGIAIFVSLIHERLAT